MRYIPITVSDEYVQGDGVAAGAEGSHNDVALVITFGEMWEGTAKTIVWHDANGENATVTALTTDMLKEGETEVYIVPIPAEPKKVAGEMLMTIKGATVDGTTETSATLSVTGRFDILPSDWDASAETSADITATEAEQFQAELEAIKTTIADARSAASEAAASAESAASDAATATASVDKAAGYAESAAASVASIGSSVEEAENAKTTAQAAQTAAEAAQKAAGTSATAAATSETNAAASEKAAAGSAAAAGTSASAASTSASAAAKSATSASGSATSASNSATSAAGSASAAAGSASAAETSMANAKAAQTGAETAKSGAESAKAGAESAKTAAAASESNAASSATAAASSAKAAATSATNANSSASAASTSATNAAGNATAAQSAQTAAESAKTAAEAAEAVVAESATAAAEKATLAESWAVGGTGTRTGEDSDNSKYWSKLAEEKAKEIEDIAESKGIMLIATYDPDKDGSVLEADAARKLKTAADITVGDKTNSFDGSGGISFTLADIGAEASGTAASAISAHNTSTTAHSDIRTALNGKETAGAAATVQGNLDTHAANTTLHITASERTTWNAKQAAIAGGASTITGSNLTANRALVSNSSGKVAVSAVTSTELGYLDGVTSAIQTQLNNKETSGAAATVQSNLDTHTGDTTVHITADERSTWNGKQAAITGGATTITSSNLTTSRALVSDSSGKVSVSAVTSTELGYLDGVTSSVQTQLNAKATAATASVTLSTSDWSSGSSDYYCSKTVSGVTSSNKVIVTPTNTAAAATAWGKYGVYASAQGSNSLTFRATKKPSESIIANILIIN